MTISAESIIPMINISLLDISFCTLYSPSGQLWNIWCTISVIQTVETPCLLQMANLIYWSQIYKYDKEFICYRHDCCSVSLMLHSLLSNTCNGDSIKYSLWSFDKGQEYKTDQKIPSPLHPRSTTGYIFIPGPHFILHMHIDLVFISISKQIIFYL